MINSYNFQAIVALNDYLIKIKKLDDVLKHLCSFLKNDFGIDKLVVKLDNNKLYETFEGDTSAFLCKNFFININDEKELEVLIYYEKEREEDVLDSFSLVETTFKVVSQTLYNKYLEYKLNESSLKDNLTGLYNRKFINEYLKSVLPLTKREDKKMAFLKVGVDHFKAVIDEFNYEVGDKVLKGLANILEESVRKSDIVARIDADEFLIVLHNINSENNAIMIANKIIENFKDVKVIVDEDTKQTLMKTICTGISMYPDDAQEVEEIYKSSDIALYEAKNKGRSQLVKFKKEGNNSIELF